MESNRSCITINCGCCENKSAGNGDEKPSGDGTPIGTVIAYMGVRAPEHYLICDGAELSIIDYPALAKQIQDEFGIVNYFGGNGITSFALPDLRNEFLRGYHGEAAEQLSGNIGNRQEATEIPLIWRGDTSDPSLCTFDPSRVLIQQYHDKYIGDNPFNTGFIIRNMSTYSTEGTAVRYTTRPMNVAVLYCIKYN